MSEKIVDEAWKATGIFSRYDINELGETDDLLGWAGKLVLAPPTDPIVNTGIVVKSMLEGERPPEHASRKYVQMIPLFGKQLEAWGVTLPDIDGNKWGAVQRLSDVPMKTYFPPDPVGAMWSSPNAWVPGNELWNRRQLEKRINKPYEEVMKQADELKRQEAWWRDATR